MSDGPTKDIRIPPKEALRLRLGNPSFEYMDALFAPIVKLDERGGTRRGDKQPRHNGIDHVEMSWTNTDQLDYATGAEGYLADFLLGTNGITHKAVESLEAKIKRKGIEAAKNGYEYYGITVIKALVEIYEEFGEAFPNWMPAIAAMFRLAGTAGTGLAISFSESFLYSAMLDPQKTLDMYALDEDSVHTFGNSHIQHKAFGGQHKLDGNGITDSYEVACTGETTAKTIVVQARNAALWLSQQELIRKAYHNQTESERITYMESYSAINVRDQVLLSYAHAKEKFQSV